MGTPPAPAPVYTIRARLVRGARQTRLRYATHHPWAGLLAGALTTLAVPRHQLTPRDEPIFTSRSSPVRRTSDRGCPQRSVFRLVGAKTIGMTEPTKSVTACRPLTTSCGQRDGSTPRRISGGFAGSPVAAAAPRSRARQNVRMEGPSRTVPGLIVGSMGAIRADEGSRTAAALGSTGAGASGASGG